MRAPRIVLVDDDQVTLDALATLLKQHGCETIRCTDGAKALEATGSGNWDLVILDLGLPSPDPSRVATFDGIKVLQWMARLKRRIPILVFTGSQDPAVAEKAIEAGAIGVVRKGDPVGQFMAAVKNALQRMPGPASAPSAPASPTPPAQQRPGEDHTTYIWKDSGEGIADS